VASAAPSPAPPRECERERAESRVYVSMETEDELPGGSALDRALADARGSRPPKVSCRGTDLDLTAIFRADGCAVPGGARKIPMPGDAVLAVEVPRSVRVAAGEKAKVPLTLRNLDSKPLTIDVSTLFGSAAQPIETRRDGRELRPALMACASGVVQRHTMRVTIEPRGSLRAVAHWRASTSFFGRIGIGPGCAKVAPLPRGRYQVLFELFSDSASALPRRVPVQIEVD
jgi:hypothetical protein